MSALADQTRWMDATDQAALVASGEVSPSELLEAAIERIERLEQARSTRSSCGGSIAHGCRPQAAICLMVRSEVCRFCSRTCPPTYAGQPLTNGNVALHDTRDRSPPATRRS